MAIGPTYEWFLTFILIKNDASHPCISDPCMVCLPIFAVNVNINHSWICKGLQTSNGTDHGIYKLTETLKPQIGILNLSSHTHIFASFFNPRKFQQMPGQHTPGTPKYNYFHHFLHKQVVFSGLWYVPGICWSFPSDISDSVVFVG